jgi:thioredoxin 1
LTHCNFSKYREYLIMLKKFLLLFIIQLFVINTSISMEKETTFNKKLFDKAQSEGKIVIISSWIKYCSSCASQMRVLNQAKNEGKLLDVNFQNIEYFSFDVTNKEIAELFNVKFQTTLLIFKDNKEVYRSLGETTEDLIYQALKKTI